MNLKLGDKIIGFTCVKCYKEFSRDDFRYTCDECGNNLDVLYDYRNIGRQWSRGELSQNPDPSLWRYLPLLPVAEAPATNTIQVGGTPLVNLPEIAVEYGVKKLLLKDDTRNPSGSLKDRATEIGVRHAEEMGKDVIIAASTGNAAASLSALCAFYKKKAVIVAPQSAPPAKLTQILQYGAVLCPVKGNYDSAFDLSLEIAEKFGWYLRSTGINPILSEGKKTAALEIAEQTNWNPPDAIFVPVGDGCIIAGMYKGFYDLLQLGWINKIPRLIAVQSSGSPAIVDALETGTEMKPVKSDTVADSISVDYPRDGIKAIDAVKESGGFGIAVDDELILSAQKKLSASAGIFAEPAASASFAGFIAAREQNLIVDNETVLLLITGTGLKDIKAAQRMIKIPTAIEPSLNEFTARWEALSNAEGNTK